MSVVLPTVNRSGSLVPIEGCPAAFVSAFDLAPGASEIELARLVALFFAEDDEGLQELSIIQTPDGRFSQRLLFDTPSGLTRALDSVADQRLEVIKRADALSLDSVMWIGPPSRAPRTLWPTAGEHPTTGASWEDDAQQQSEDEEYTTLSNDESGSSNASVIEMQHPGSPLRAWTERDATVEALKFFAYWDPATMGRQRRPRRPHGTTNSYRVLFRGTRSCFGGAQYFTKYVRAFSSPCRRLQHLPYTAKPRVSVAQILAVAAAEPLPHGGRRTFCLAVGLENGATARCLFDTAIVGGDVLPCVGDRLLARVATAAEGQATSVPSPLRSVVVKRVSRWSRKRSGVADASPVVVERFWSSPADDVHDRGHVQPLAHRALRTARQALREDFCHPTAVRIEAAWAYHDLSAVELRVCLDDRAIPRADLEVMLAEISRKVHLVAGAPVHWAPAAAS